MLPEDKPIPFVRELMKGKSEEKILDAEHRMREFVKLVAEMVEDMDEEEPAALSKEEPAIPDENIEMKDLGNGTFVFTLPDMPKKKRVKKK